MGANADERVGGEDVGVDGVDGSDGRRVESQLVGEGGKVVGRSLSNYSSRLITHHLISISGNPGQRTNHRSSAHDPDPVTAPDPLSVFRANPPLSSSPGRPSQPCRSCRTPPLAPTGPAGTRRLSASDCAHYCLCVYCHCSCLTRLHFTQSGHPSGSPDRLCPESPAILVESFV